MPASTILAEVNESVNLHTLFVYLKFMQSIGKPKAYAIATAFNHHLNGSEVMWTLAHCQHAADEVYGV